MAKVFVIPDVHLKFWMFDDARSVLKSLQCDKVVLLGDLVDDWGQENNLRLYEKTLHEAADFMREYDALFCYGNHDLSYKWERLESGYSYQARDTVLEGLANIVDSVDESNIAIIHRIGNTLFSHAGLTKEFANEYFAGEDIDDVIYAINGMGEEELWNDYSPIWVRPQDYNVEAYTEGFFQVVGHTPVEEPQRDGMYLSLDTFSTYSNGRSYGNEKFVVVDTIDGSWTYAD